MPEHQRPDFADFYDALFESVARRCGPLGSETHTGMVGFSAGGPISVVPVGDGRGFVTCELAVLEDQVASTDGLGYEFLVWDEGDLDDWWDVLTALGDMSLEVRFGDRHTIDVSQVVDEPGASVSLELFSQTSFGGGEFGVYRVRRVDSSSL